MQTTLRALLALLVASSIGCSSDAEKNDDDLTFDDAGGATDASRPDAGGGGGADASGGGQDQGTVGMPGPNGDSCVAAADCLSGFCSVAVCAACGADTECGTGSICDSGVCVGTKSTGEACASGSECASGFCPPQDGVCCDVACDGDCVSCDGGKTGGDSGTCAPVAPATDPDAECADEGADTCGSDGSGCNGDAATPACQQYAAGTPCGGSSCANGEQTSAGTCDGMGTCGAGSTSACAPYVCGADACLTDCSSDADCEGNNSCVNGSCGLLPAGASCGDAAQCDSGNCVDGYCCDSACGMTCMACNVGGSEGQCSNVPMNTDPDNECSGSAVCDGSGACMPFCAGASEATTTLDTEEQAFLVELNNYRASNNLGPVENCRSLSRSAQGHSEDMRDQNYFSHTGLNGSSPWGRACDSCYDRGCGPSTQMAENIAAGNATGAATFNQWKNSPGHNANMLGGSFTRIGIGRATGGGTYGVYWTTVFAAADEASCD